MLDEKLAGASHVPVHAPAGTSTVAGAWCPFLTISGRSGISDVVVWYYQNDGQLSRTTKRRSSRHFRHRWPCKETPVRCAVVDCGLTLYMYSVPWYRAVMLWRVYNSIALFPPRHLDSTAARPAAISRLHTPRDAGYARELITCGHEVAALHLPTTRRAIRQSRRDAAPDAHQRCHE